MAAMNRSATWGRERPKAEPFTFGTMQSKLWQMPP